MEVLSLEQTLSEAEASHTPCASGMSQGWAEAVDNTQLSPILLNKGNSECVGVNVHGVLCQPFCGNIYLLFFTITATRRKIFS